MPSFGHGVLGWRAEQPLRIGLVLAKQQLGVEPPAFWLGRQLQLTQKRMIDARPRPGPTCSISGFDASSSHDQVLRNQAVGSTCSVSVSGPGVGHPHAHQHVERVGFGVVDLDDPVAVVVECARVQELVLGVVLAASTVLVDQILVRKRRLRVVVPPAVPGVARQRRPGTTSTPWRPRRGCPAPRSGRRCAP